jgi:hypothetical protein
MGHVGKSGLIKGNFPRPFFFAGRPLYGVCVCADDAQISCITLAFRELYAPRAWEEERLASRIVIYLDLIRSTKRILNVLENAPETPHWVKLLRMRLIPLCCVQRDLEAHLGLAEGEVVHVAAIIPEPAKRRQHHKADQRSLAERVIEALVACREDMDALWKHDDVRGVLERHGLWLDRYYPL